MTYGEIRAYMTAHEREESEKLVLNMNVMAIAFGGTAKDRKKMADAILGNSVEFDPAEFETLMSSAFLASPSDTENTKDIKEWAAGQFDASDPAFHVKGK